MGARREDSRTVTYAVEALEHVERGTWEGRAWTEVGEHESSSRARVALSEWLFETDASPGEYRVLGSDGMVAQMTRRGDSWSRLRRFQLWCGHVRRLGDGFAPGACGALQHLLRRPGDCRATAEHAGHPRGLRDDRQAGRDVSDLLRGYTRPVRRRASCVRGPTWWDRASALYAYFRGAEYPMSVVRAAWTAGHMARWWLS